MSRSPDKDTLQCCVKCGAPLEECSDCFDHVCLRCGHNCVEFEICSMHGVPMNFKGNGCACCFADQESAECKQRDSTDSEVNV